MSDRRKELSLENSGKLFIRIDVKSFYHDYSAKAFFLTKNIFINGADKDDQLG